MARNTTASKPLDRRPRRRRWGRDYPAGPNLRRCVLRCAAWCVVWLTAGCQQHIIDAADREVYRLIASRQHAALGEVHDTHIGAETGALTGAGAMYSFTPNPLPATLPDAFTTPAPSLDPSGTTPQPATDDPGTAGRVDEGSEHEAGDGVGADTDRGAEDGTDGGTPNGAGVASGTDAPPPTETSETTADATMRIRDDATVFSISDALAYAMRHARELQDAKEDLYLAALDLTLERHLWTPQFVASVRADYADAGRTGDFDRTLSIVSDVSVSQRLPYGGEVVARVVDSLMRDLGTRVTTGEPMSAILSADIPLLRGAGRVAFESRYRAERELIYAVRTYERFRRAFLVDIAGDYFDLQQAKVAIENAQMNLAGNQATYDEAADRERLGQATNIFDARRALSFARRAESTLVTARERYATAVDRFKIRIGMPVTTPLDVVDQKNDVESRAVDALLPDVDEETAIATALRYRLDLRNSADRLDDGRRGVMIAKNRILPDLGFTGSMTVDGDRTQNVSFTFGDEDTTWRAGLRLDVDDRKTERNAYRASLVLLRRAERDHERFADAVRADVRRARRQLVRQRMVRDIEAFNVEENVFREAAATAQVQAGLADNQDLVDARNDLLDARNNLAGATADYRNAILEFRRDTGTLRIDDDGRWVVLGRRSDAGGAAGP
ncbi:MAG: TolC family protein [Phycisphaerae bacterium]